MPADLIRLADRFSQLREVLDAPTTGQAAVPKILAFQLGGLLEGAGLNPLVPLSMLNLLDLNLGNEQARNPLMMLFGRYFLAITLLQSKRASPVLVRDALVPLSERLEVLARTWSSGPADADELSKLNGEIRELAEEIRRYGDGTAA